MRIAVLIFLFLLSGILRGQMCPCEFKGSGEKTLRNEIGVNLFNAQQLLSARKPTFGRSYFNGVMFKHHFDHFSLRAGFDYIEQDYRYHEENNFFYALDQVNSFSKNLLLGVETTRDLGKLQPYIALDLVLGQNRRSGIYENSSFYTPLQQVPYSLNYLAIGGSPAFGIKYRFTRHFSLTAETSVALMYWNGYRSSNYRFGLSSVELIINPLRALTANYHF